MAVNGRVADRVNCAKVTRIVSQVFSNISKPCDKFGMTF